MPRRPSPESGPPSIAFLRDKNGVQGVRVTCHACGRRVTVPWEKVPRPDSTPFTDLHFRCDVPECQSKKTSAMPDWPASMAPRGPYG